MKKKQQAPLGLHIHPEARKRLQTKRQGEIQKFVEKGTLKIFTPEEVAAYASSIGQKAADASTLQLSHDQAFDQSTDGRRTKLMLRTKRTKEILSSSGPEELDPSFDTEL